MDVCACVRVSSGVTQLARIHKIKTSLKHECVHND